MIPLRLRRLSRAVLGGFLIGSSLIGQAQENNSPGIVRITDSRPRGVPIRNAGYHGAGGYSAGYGQGDCPECYDDCDHGKKHHKLGKHFCEHYCKHSADHGYSTPGKVPIYRNGVQYNQYFPAAWYGTQNGGLAAGQVYPTIYQPTDTTQLGFYYQHVPFWQPNPNALPPKPIPAQWHRFVRVGHTPWNHGGWGHGHGGYGYGDANCPPGSGWVETTNMTPTPAQPTPAGQPVLAPAPGAEPVPAPVPAPPAQNDSALNLHIRRAALQQ